MSLSQKFCLLVFTLLLIGPNSVFANQASEDSVAKAESTETTKTTDDEDSGKKASEKPKDPNRGRFLPIPIFITEPAIGEGLGILLAYFHRKKDAPEKNVASPSSIADISMEQSAPPTVTGVFAAYTSNETAIAGVGHMNSFKDDHIRFTGVLGVADINSTFYVLDRPFKFNLQGLMIFQETRFRIKDSRWFLGVGLSYLNADNTFKVDLPDETPIDLFRTQFQNAGLAAKLAWDSRDNTSMPNKGQFLDLGLWRYDKNLGGDFDYWNTELKLLSFHQLHEKFVLGLRLEYSTISGQVPFFAVPWVTLRGIPAMRYQGEQVVVAEIEGRYYFRPKWAVLAFAGKGEVSSDFPGIDMLQDIHSWGVGGRYKIFEAQNVWIGLDIARGPEDTNWYIQIGQSW